MTDASVGMLVVAGTPAPAGVAIEVLGSWSEVVERSAGGDPLDAVLVDADAVTASASEIASVGVRSALVLVAIDPDAEHVLAWLRRGADDVVGRDELANGNVWRRLRFAIERHRRGKAQRAFALADAGTGLPQREQLASHLSHLLALREREPAPMAVLAFRIEGCSSGADGAGADPACEQALRREIAVRLRAGVRGSDIVAAIDADGFAILLGSILAPSDADRIAAKLVAALAEPIRVGDRERRLAVAVGIAHYPLDGQGAERLLRRALALAAAAPAMAHGEAAMDRAALGEARVAANDER